MITERPATHADIEYFCGRKAYYSVIGKTIELDGRPVCMAGVFFTPKFIAAFSHWAEDIPVPLMTKWKYAKKLTQYIRSLNLPVIAQERRENPTGEKLLKSLGFKYLTTENNEKLYTLE